MASTIVRNVQVLARKTTADEESLDEEAVPKDTDLWADVEASIRPCGWERLLSLRAEASLPLSIEFLCSLRPLLGFERRDDVGIAMRHDSRLIFTLLAIGRLLTFLMSMSYFGRPSNSNRVYSSDMLFFWSIALQRQVNLAVFIARFLWSQTYGTRITVVYGPLITLLHSTLDFREVRYGGLDREGPSPRPHPAPEPQSTFQQGQSSTGVENLQIPLWAQTLSTQMQGLQYHMSGIHGRLEELHTRFTEFEQRYEADMTRLVDQQEAQWTSFFNIGTPVQTPVQHPSTGHTLTPNASDAAPTHPNPPRF
ncbi:unnamed protein product [Cuscuta campestris]|uniref:Uncharacterized protein n=1 Tax=Cuscuta campestris TaxID=132261 RepID=A0A484MPW9_9ASTE|nr:unnamed protein product [Cuscuta campestris]